VRKEVCTKCHNEMTQWSGSDEERWESHHIVICPAQYLMGYRSNGGKDTRLTRNVDEEEPPEFCPKRGDHLRTSRRPGPVSLDDSTLKHGPGLKDELDSLGKKSILSKD